MHERQIDKWTDEYTLRREWIQIQLLYTERQKGIKIRERQTVLIKLIE